MEQKNEDFLFTRRCKYCDAPVGSFNKAGKWFGACTGCKISLTKMLRSGKYTKDKLLNMRWKMGKWEK